MDKDFYPIIGIILSLAGTAIVFYSSSSSYPFDYISLIIGLFLIIAGLFFIFYIPGNISVEAEAGGIITLNALDFLRIIVSVFILFGGSLAFFIGVISLYSNGDFTLLAAGLGLIIIGFLLLPIEHKKIIRETRDYIFETNWAEFKIFRDDELEMPEERNILWKKPEGFAVVKPGEYEKIPEEAIDPFTLYKIHDLITQGKKIVKCNDCGVYYDEKVWKYYGKICAIMGCSNSEV